MGINYGNMIVYGKEFDCFVDAMEHLQRSKSITEEEFNQALNDGEFYADNGISFNVYSYYTGGAGILGYEVSAKSLYTKEAECKASFDIVDKFIGNGCEVHEFVQVS